MAEIILVINNTLTQKTPELTQSQVDILFIGLLVLLGLTFYLLHKRIEEVNKLKKQVLLLKKNNDGN